MVFSSFHGAVFTISPALGLQLGLGRGHQTASFLWNSAASGQPEAKGAREMPKEKSVSDTSPGDGCPERKGGKISFTAEHT